MQHKNCGRDHDFLFNLNEPSKSNLFKMPNLKKTVIDLNKQLRYIFRSEEKTN